MKKVIPSNAILVPNSSVKVFSGQIFDVYQWPQKMFDGSTTTFEMLKRPDTVEVIAVIDEKLLILEEEQPHHGTRLSFPGGRVDDTDESLLLAAQREMHEETGYSFKNWRLLMVRQQHSKMEWFIFTYLAWGKTRQDDPHVDAGERITPKLLAFSEVKSLSEKRVGYIGEAEDIFAACDDLKSLLNFPEFQGQEVDR